MRAADVMTPDPVCISPDAPIIDAIRLMLQRKFSDLPVVDARGSLVGIVTEGDLLRRIETGTQRAVELDRISDGFGAPCDRVCPNDGARERST
jgi:CBS domain-containing protein